MTLPVPYDFTGLLCTLKLLNVPFSFPSFTASSFFTYTWVDASVNTVPIPANTTFEISDLNALLQSVMITNKHYLIDGSGNNQYYIGIFSNPIYYACTLQAQPFPTSLPATYTKPAGAAWSFPGVATYIQLNFANTDICNVLGFLPGSYPPAQTPASSNYSVNSQNSPEVSPYSCVQLLGDFVGNGQAVPANLINQAPISDVPYGGNITYEPKLPAWVPCIPKTASTIVVYLADQYSNPLIVLDKNWVAQIAFKQASKIV